MFLNFIHDLLSNLGPDFFKRNTTEKIALLEKDKFLKDETLVSFFSEVHNGTQALFLGFVHDLLLQMSEEFFTYSADKKEEVLNNSKLVILNELRSSLLNTKDFDEFLRAVKDVVLSLKDLELITSTSPLLKNFVTFVSKEIIPIVDKLSVNFFIADTRSKKIILDKILEDKGMFNTILKYFLEETSNEESQKVFFQILGKVNPKQKQITIQSARDCGPSLKTDIRSHYGNDYFVFFQVNTNILGGMIIYKDGEIQDLSWMGKLNNLQKVQA